MRATWLNVGQELHQPGRDLGRVLFGRARAGPGKGRKESESRPSLCPVLPHQPAEWISSKARRRKDAKPRSWDSEKEEKMAAEGMTTATGPEPNKNSEPRSVEVLQRALDQREAVLQAVPPALQAISPARHSQQTHLEDPLSRDRTPHQPKQPWPQPNDPSDHQTAPQTVRLYPEVYTDHDSPHRSSVDIDQHLSERLQFGDRRCHYIDKPRLICFPPIPSLVSKQGV